MGVAGTVSVRRARTRKTMRDKLRTQAQNIDHAGKVSNRLTTASYDVSAWPEQVQPSPQDGRKGARQIENKRKKGRSGGVPNCLTVSSCFTVSESAKRNPSTRIGYGAGSEPVDEPMRRLWFDKRTANGFGDQLETPKGRDARYGASPAGGRASHSPSTAPGSRD